MKTLGRILIILLAFALVMGITYTAVSAASSSMRAPTFERGSQGLPRPEGVRPPNREEREFRGGASGLRLLLGIVKNTVIIAIIVALVVWLKDFMRKRTRDTQPASE
jgi:hypothetical protein